MSDMESLFIEIVKDVFKSSNNIIPPPPPPVSILKTEIKSCYLLGDFNLNLLNADTHNNTQAFIDLMYSVSLFPTITQAYAGHL